MSLSAEILISLILYCYELCVVLFTSNRERTISDAYNAPSVILPPTPLSTLFRARAEAGQALASRPDLLPGEYLEELQKLQDDVPTFGNDIAFRIVEEELKQKFVDVFELIEPEPVAGTCRFERR